MSTRVIVAQPAGDTWTGVGVHDGGPPRDAGNELLSMFTLEFFGRVDRMVNHFIVDHPHGWFHLTKPVTWATDDAERTVDELTCTCPQPGSSCDALHYEWAYVLTPPGIFIYKSVPAPDAPTTEQLLADATAGRPISMESLMAFVHVPVGLVAWGDHETMNTIGASE